MRMTLQRRLMLVITMIVILTVATTGYMSYSRSTSTLDEQTRKSMLEQSRSEINTISNTMKEQWTKLDITTSDDDVLRILKMTPEEPGYAEEVAHVNKDLVSFVKKWGDMEHAYVVNKQGIVLADSDTKLIGTDKKTSTYTKDTLAKGKGQVSETLVSKTSGALMMEFTQPVKENGETIGFIADSVLVDSFARYLSQVKVNETSSSYAYMVDAQGTMLYHPQKDKVGKPVENDSIKKVVERLKNGEEVSPDTTVYEYKGAQKYASYALVPETHWILVITADQKELFAPIRDMMWNLFLIGLVIVILSSILGYFFARRISRPIRNLTTVIEKTANFDLAVNEKFNKEASMNTSKDEIGSMVRAMQTMRQGLRDMVERLVQSSSIIDGNAQNLQNAAQEMRSYAHENSATTEQLSAGMEETAASTEEISASTEEVKRNVEHISAKVQHGSELSDEITHRALQLKTEALESNSSAQSLYESVKHNLEASLEQVKTIDQINFLAESILAIAQQTNLLSLNAAIEAARAGEAGRGFSVVAEEIRKLADQSSQTVSSIQGMVEVVISSVENMKESSTQLLEFIDLKVLNDYRKLLNVSEQYNGDALLVKSLMDDVSGITEELHVTMTNITTAIQAMAVTSSEGAAGAQDIATKTSDIVDQTARVEAAASENRSSILHLREVLSQFKF